MKTKELTKLSLEQLQALVHDLQTHQVELEAQLNDLNATKRDLEISCEELRQSRDKYRELYNSVPVGFVTINEKYSIRDANAAAAKMLGVNVAQLKKSRFSDFIAPIPESQDTFRLQVQKIWRTGWRRGYDIVIQKKDGSRFAAHLYCFLVDNGPHKNSLLRITFADITARKQAEEALKASEEKFRSLFEHMAEGFSMGEIILDSQGKPFDFRYLEVNQAWEKWTHIPRAKAIGKTHREVIPHPLPEIIETYGKVALSGIPCTFENHSPFVDNWMRAYVYSPGKGQFAVITADITERKKAVEALRQSEEKYRSLFSNMGEVFALHEIILDADGKPFDYRFLEINSAFEMLTGLSRERVLGRTIKEILPGIGYYWIEIYGKVALTGEPVHFQDFSTALKKWFEAYAYSPRKNQCAVIFTDITERKQAEAALGKAKDELEIKVKERTRELAESEEKYRLLVENASENVVVIQNNIIEFVNNKVFELTGYTEKEIISLPFTYFVHPEDQPILIERAQKQARGESVVHSYEFRIVHKDGSIKYVQANSALISWKGKPATLGLISDITKRKIMEQALLNSKNELTEVNEQLKQYAKKITQVQEEERKRIAYELHDDTAQYLALIKLELDSLLNSGKIQDRQIIQKLQYLEKDAGRAVDDVRRYSHELRPGVLEHLGLQAALEQIAEDHNKVGQIQVEVNVEGIEPEISEDVKLGFFRIAQESINNSRKHAKSAHAYIDLKFTDIQIQMIVRDEGAGFDVSKAFARIGEKGSLGLMSMQERANLIGADLKIESQPEKGTTVKVEFGL